LAVNQEVQVRGFLYHAEDGRWILSDRPGLKCCCVSKQKNKIIIDGPIDFEGSCRPVVVKGVLRMQSDQMHLTQSALVTESLPWGAMIPVVLILVLIGMGIIWWRRRS